MFAGPNEPTKEHAKMQQCRKDRAGLGWAEIQRCRKRKEEKLGEKDRRKEGVVE